jgi:2,3-bisphosphoglycerate-independent phosphoglycerate mutase
MIQKLNKLNKLNNRKGPVVLIILDGVGIGKDTEANAIYKAKSPFLDSLKQHNLYCELKAHGKAIGMPTDEDMGNSEVGHNALGAGRIYDQGSLLVKRAIESSSIYSNKTWIEGLSNCKKHNSTLHFIGLLSDGNVHNHIDYQLKIIEKSAQEYTKIRLHILLDGRDVEARSALTYIKKLNQLITTLQKKNIDIKIASGGGRMITTMDRYNADWSIVERGYNAHVHGIGNSVKSAEEAITRAYESDFNLNDQYIPPFVICENNKPVGIIQDNDTVFFTNFRGDRSIEISQAFENKNFNKFNRKNHPNIFYAGMMQYDGDKQIPKNFLVTPPQIKNCLSEFLCHENISSFAISETQKYGHVTYFWNGNKSGYVNKSLESFHEIKSDTIPFNEAPDMKAYEITEKTLELLNSNNYKFGRINFPNGDMVGHTGDIKATIQSIETIDICTKKLVDKILKLNGIAIILADHGNADEMFTIKNNIKLPKTSHTLNPVPCAIFDSNYQNEYKINTKEKFGLANIASTILELLDLSPPKIYYKSILEFK